MADFSHSLKHHRKYHRWTPDEIESIKACPRSTAKSLAADFGVSQASIEHVRQRHGRYRDPAEPADMICVACDKRVVWAESPGARRLHLCKRCYNVERGMRIAEEKESNALRQAEHKLRASGGATRARG